MPSILDLRRRIRSVKNTQQITRAMKMVAAARLRRAQERVISARPYAALTAEFLSSLAARTEDRSHPLLAERPVRRICVVLITADRGLCGAFNATLIRAAQKYLEEKKSFDIRMIAAGRKGRDFFRRREVALVGEYSSLFQRRVEFESAQKLAAQISELYANETVDAVDLIYNEFKSLFAPRLVTERLLPIKTETPAQGESQVDYIYEQPPSEIIGRLLPRYIEAEVYRALIESQAAEFASKMTAMDTATNNATDLIASYTLHLNRVRQAAITKEIIEIVSGAAAL
ncbi:MAG: ATP synthase F1 subunit gamma [Acidobacteriota bacterium]|nr:ATP synthase F1 subunit gamma [Acidobacteriota bacterium]